MSGLERLIHRITTGDILSEVASNISTLITKKRALKNGNDMGVSKTSY